MLFKKSHQMRHHLQQKPLMIYSDSTWSQIGLYLKISWHSYPDMNSLFQWNTSQEKKHTCPSTRLSDVRWFVEATGTSRQYYSILYETCRSVWTNIPVLLLVPVQWIAAIAEMLEPCLLLLHYSSLPPSSTIYWLFIEWLLYKFLQHRNQHIDDVLYYHW